MGFKRISGGMFTRCKGLGKRKKILIGWKQMSLFDEDEIEPTRLNRLSLRQRKVSENLNSIRSSKPAKESQSVSPPVKSLSLGSFMTATANILPREMSEVVKGDLIEIREEMKNEGHSNAWINFTSFGKIVLVIFATLKIKLSDFVHSKKSGTNNS